MDHNDFHPPPAETADDGGSGASKIKRRARGRPSPEQAAALRESFLTAALDSFLEKGYSATSIEAIAREAGVAKITIYRQFDNKEALFREVAHRAVSAARETMQNALVHPGPDDRQVLIDLVERLYLSASEPKTLALMRLVIAEAVRFPELAKALYSENSYVLAPVVDYLAEASRAGRLRVADPQMAAIQLSTLAFGGVRFFISRPLAGAEERRIWSASIVDLVLRGWAPGS